MKVAYFVMRYPSATQTFIEREMFALAAQGIEIEVRPIWDTPREPPTTLAAPANFRVVRPRAWWRMIGGALGEILRRPSLIPQGLRVFARNLPRHAEGWFMTIWGILTGLALTRELRDASPDVFHGAWATAPATVAAVLGHLCGRPFTFGAHAYDIHRHGGDPLLPVKLRTAKFVHTTTQANVDYLIGRFPDRRAPIILARRGLGEEALRRANEIANARIPQGSPPGRPFRLLSVGRLVPKKGQLHQIAAIAELQRRGRTIDLRIIGDGPLRPELETQIAAAGLGNRVRLDGALPPAGVWSAYAWADALWHTGIVDAQGDRDGLPNVVPEAMGCGLPVISTTAGGAAEAIADGESGLIVADPANTVALADAVDRLIADPELCHRLGGAAREWVGKNFVAAINTQRLAKAFAAAAFPAA